MTPGIVGSLNYLKYSSEIRLLSLDDTNIQLNLNILASRFEILFLSVAFLERCFPFSLFLNVNKLFFSGNQQYTNLLNEFCVDNRI